MQALLLAASPFIVNGITHLLKKIPAFDMISDAWQKTLLRFIVATLSFASVFATAWISGVPVDPTAINTYVETLLIFLSATGSFFLFHTPVDNSVSVN